MFVKGLERVTDDSDQLWVSIVPHSNHSLGTAIYLDRPISRVLQNVSTEPLVIWDETCSWGYYSVTVELTDPNGEVFKVALGPTMFNVNYPRPIVPDLGVGESLLPNVSQAYRTLIGTNRRVAATNSTELAKVS